MHQQRCPRNSLRGAWRPSRNFWGWLLLARLHITEEKAPNSYKIHEQIKRKNKPYTTAKGWD